LAAETVADFRTAEWENLRQARTEAEQRLA
jgi:hypothetical protein